MEFIISSCVGLFILHGGIIIQKYIIKRKNKNLYIKQKLRINKKNFNIYKNEICTICLDNLKQTDKCILLYCDHLYHKKCIKKWLYMDEYLRCPNCNCRITDKKKKKLYDI